MLPHSAPSVAISTGSGLTLRSVRPSFLRCAEKAFCEALLGELEYEEVLLQEYVMCDGYH